jgi:hypothetical protein
MKIRPIGAELLYVEGQTDESFFEILRKRLKT